MIEEKIIKEIYKTDKVTVNVVETAIGISYRLIITDSHYDIHELINSSSLTKREKKAIIIYLEDKNFIE